jgi:hypothetical protein
MGVKHSMHWAGGDRKAKMSVCAVRKVLSVSVQCLRVHHYSVKLEVR